MNYQRLIDSLNTSNDCKKETSLYNFSNSKYYNHSKDSAVKFIKNYCDMIIHSESIPMIGEVVGDTQPLISEFVFKFKTLDIDEGKPYNEKLLSQLAIIHQDMIDHFFDVSTTSFEKICYVCESSKWEETNYAYYKIRLQFPFCVTTQKFIQSDIRNHLMEKFKENDIQEFFDCECYSSWDDAYLKPAMYYELYGSIKNPKCSPTRVTKILTEVYEEEDLSHSSYYDTIKNMNNREFIGDKDALYMRHSFINDKNKEIGLIIESDFDDDDEDNYVKYLYPILLSINFKTTKTKNKFEVDDNFNMSISVDEENPSDFEILYLMTKLIKKERFKFEYFVQDLGKAIFNAVKNTKKYTHDFGFKFWRNLVLKNTLEWKDIVTESNYELLEENNNITFKTICFYAKEDSPQEFSEWHKNWVNIKVGDAVDSQNDRDLSMCFYRKYFMNFMFGGDVNKHFWFRFENNLMVMCDKHYIFTKLMKDFKNIFYKYQIILESKKLQTMQEGDSGHKQKIKAFDDKIDIVKKIQEKTLGNNTMVKKILECSETWFYIESLNDKWDKNPNVLGCKNCVIELTSTKAHVRDGKPEDFLQKKLGVKYCQNYCKTSKNVKELMKYLEQVFPVPEVRHYMIKDLSSILYGKNSEKQMRIWIGETNGSKSILAKIIQEVFGSYYCDFPGEYLSAKQKNGGPSPELAQIKNTRIAIIQEPDKHASFKGARIKKLTGGDSMFARSLHENGGSIKTTCKFLVVCNCVPEIEGLDEATKNRVVQVPFEGRWIKKGAKKDEEHFVVPKTHKEQVQAKLYHMDINFEDKVGGLAKAMLWFMIENYSVYQKEGLIPPSYMKEWMDQYWKKFDRNICFLSENVEKIYTQCDCEDANNCNKCYGKKEIKDKAYAVTSSQFYNHYKNWFRSEFSNKTLPLKANVIEMFETRDKLGKLSKDKKWYGIKLVENKSSDSLGLF